MINKANILHCDISLLNLLLIALQDDSSFDFVLHSHLSLETCQLLLRKLQRISHQGLLADWGYAVPLCPSVMAKPPSPIDAITPNGDAIPHQPTSPALAPLSLLTSLATLDETLTSPITIPGDLDENMIPA